MTEMSKDVVQMWLDSPMADHGLSIQAKHQLSDILLADDAYQRFSTVILSPAATANEATRTTRSWRAMKLLRDDLAAPAGNSILMNATRAGLLAKDIFGALGKPEANIMHVRTLLEALLDAYPSSVVSAACAGGKEGIESHLGPLLEPAVSTQTLPTVTHLVLYGCLGKQARASAEKTVMHHQQSMQQRVSISQGHRRKFVRTLSDWSFLSRLIECIEKEDENPCIGEDVCETILTIVECLGYPEKIPAQMKQQIPNLPSVEEKDSVGEDSLLSPLGERTWWDPLVAILDGDRTTDTTKVAATRIMTGIFTLATGRSSRIRKSNPPMTDASEDNLGDKNEDDIDEEASKNLPHENKLLDWGLTSKIHQALLEHLPQLIHALLRNLDGADGGATKYFERGSATESIPGVPHPGRCRIVPFTSWRLHVVTLLSELLTYTGALSEKEDEEGQTVDDEEEAEALRLSAMNAIMALPLPPDLQTQGEAPPDASQPINPWPFLCDLLFEYPENSMYHFQFIRLFKAICMEHHEPSLRLVLQKSKFVSRAVKVCSGEPSALRGVLIICMNTLRLRSQSLAPSAFLRQFLGSHDGWKGFSEKLLEITMGQERPSHPIPGKESMFHKQIGLDLGSRYAAQLGFDGIDAHVDDGSTADDAAAVTGAKKKKKKNRRKNKKDDDTQPKNNGQTSNVRVKVLTQARLPRKPPEHAANQHIFLRSVDQPDEDDEFET